MRLILVNYLILALAACRSHSLSPSHPRYPVLIRCRDKGRSIWAQGSNQADNSMAICYKQLVLAVMDKLKRGEPLPALRVDRLDPLHIPLMNLELQELNMQGHIKNALCRGLTSGFNERTEFQMSAKSKRGHIVARLPVFTSHGDFEISIDLFKAIFPGIKVGDGLHIKGKFGCRWDKLVIIIFIRFDDSPNTKHEGDFVVRHVGVKLANKRMTFNFRPAFTGNETATERDRENALFSVLRTLAGSEQLQQDMLRKFEPALTAIVAENLFRILTTGFDNIDAI